MTPPAIGPILLVHNYYQQRGGEDRVFEDEVTLLRDYGHEVYTFTVHNDALNAQSTTRLAANTIWNRALAKDLATLVTQKGIRIAHFHNTFPQISPGAYRAVRQAGAAVVQTLHNYRLLCAGALLYRKGSVCQLCLDHQLPLAALAHRCYRHSLAATAGVLAMQLLHRTLGTWMREVDAYIALTEGARARFAEHLLPPMKVHVLGNFLPQWPSPAPLPTNGHALFIGRLDEPKGGRTLLETWRTTPTGLPDLMIVGDGPLSSEFQLAADQDSRITWAGFCTTAQVQELLQRASMVLIPSNSYEGFPMAMIEAWASGRPVVASQIGAMEELVHPGIDGWLTAAGTPAKWADTISRLYAQPEALSAAGAAASTRFTTGHTHDAHHKGLLTIYQKALAIRSQECQ
ncbi:MAG: glycosyl transferase family 1 [Holophagaceae bacterium]|nr:glycosyl transferase family 1 [Holophagaceae bacterium]